MIEGGIRERSFDAGDRAAEGTVALSLEVEVAGQRGKRIEEAERYLAWVEAEAADVERRITGGVREGFFRTLYEKSRVELLRTVETLS